jgi:stage V sporulation protein S
MAEPIRTLGENNKEEVLLKVKSSSPASSLASAISHGVYDGKRVTLRAIGAGAVNQAVKAVAIAGSFVAPRGLSLTVRPGFTTVTLGDGAYRSAIILYVIPSRG